MTDIRITTEFIRLDSFIKLANLVGSGGQAKMIRFVPCVEKSFSAEKLFRSMAKFCEL